MRIHCLLLHASVLMVPMQVKSGDGAVVMTNGGRGGMLNEEIFHAIATSYRWPGTQHIIEPNVTSD